jgi:Tfp pilus assembly protein PilN
MRINVNLSNRPFTNHKLFWIGLAAVFFVSLWLALFVVAEKTRVSAEINRVSMRIQQNETELQQIRVEAEKRNAQVKQVVLSEQDSLQLAAARQLIERKAFTWNRLMGDIETYIPNDTRIVSIKVEEVANASEGVAAEVEVKALGKTAAQLTEMMTSLSNSNGLFILGQTSQEQAADTGEIPFTINVTYRPSRGGA